MKKLISVMLVFCLVLGNFVPTVAGAEECRCVFPDGYFALNWKQANQIFQNREEHYKRGYYLKQEAVALGLIAQDSPKLDLQTARDIIQENESLYDILRAFTKVQMFPDFYRTGPSSGILISDAEYWLNEDGSERIVVKLGTGLHVVLGGEIALYVDNTETEILYHLWSDTVDSEENCKVIAVYLKLVMFREPPFIVTIFGYILSPYSISTADALEILKYMVGLPTILDDDQRAFQAALIVSTDKPGTADALEILKCIVRMPNVIEGTA